MERFNNKPPSGTRDFMPEEARTRERIFNIVKKVFERFSFSPIGTPALERIENLTDKYGKENEKLIFKIPRQGSNENKEKVDLALRYDLTLPLARFVAMYRGKLPVVFRRYQIGPVWRADRPGKGRFREFYQCDADIVGSSSALSDAEVILVFAEVLKSLNLKNYVIKLNSRKVLKGLLEIYKIPRHLKQGIIIVLDKFDKIGVKGVEAELKAKKISKKTINQISFDLTERVTRLRDRIILSRIGKVGLKEVDEITSLVEPNLKKGRIEFSPLLARGLDYYTGSIFEIYLNNKEVGAIASGGRYDNLIEKFTGKEIPACGGSLGIDRLFSVLSKKDEKEEPHPQVFITVWDNASKKDALFTTLELRENGIVNEVYLGNEKKIKIGDQVRFASKRGALYCIFSGPDEKIKNEVKLKDLLTGKQINVKRKILVKKLKSLLKK